MKVISQSPVLTAEAERVMPALRTEALRPATQDEIRRIIGARFATFPQAKRTEGEAAMWWADYFDALESCTAAQIEAGMAAWVRDPRSEFLPKPGKLAELARTTDSAGKWTRAFYRAKRAVEAVRGQAALPKPEGPKLDPVEVKRLADETAARLAMMAPKPREIVRRDPPCAPVDETGVSDAMKAILQARGLAPQT